MNAHRLLVDSRLLANCGRTDSAVLLAILALEELGKSLIARWGVRNEASKRQHPTHVEKQAAAFLLLAASEIRGAQRARVRKLNRRKQLNFLKIGPLCEQFCWARQGFFEDMRTALTYADSTPKWPEHITSTFDLRLVDELHRYFKQAVREIQNQSAMRLAAVIYQNGLGRL